MLAHEFRDYSSCLNTRFEEIISICSTIFDNEDICSKIIERRRQYFDGFESEDSCSMISNNEDFFCLFGDLDNEDSCSQISDNEDSFSTISDNEDGRSMISGNDHQTCDHFRLATNALVSTLEKPAAPFKFSF